MGEAKSIVERPTYHDLHITTPTLDRTSIFNLPYRVEVSCTRVCGWTVWARAEGSFLTEEKIGGEYDKDKPLRLDVAGHIICLTEGFEPS